MYCDPTLGSEVMIIRRSKMPCAVYEIMEMSTEPYGDEKQRSLADRAYQRPTSERIENRITESEEPHIFCTSE